MACYNLFISHSWQYAEAYNNLLALLNNQSSLNRLIYKNYSVPKNNPIHNASSDKELKSAIETQIKACSCLIILAGVYATYSKWINAEIEIAKKLGKRIIAIEPWGSEKTSSIVKKSADKIVKWNGDSIVMAIRGITASEII